MSSLVLGVGSWRWEVDAGLSAPGVTSAPPGFSYTARVPFAPDDRTRLGAPAYGMEFSLDFVRDIESTSIVLLMGLAGCYAARRAAERRAEPMPRSRV